jgi:thioredoxin 1
MATEITELIQIPPNKKVIIDFYATWCGPCARVTPIIDELAEKYENIVFLKVNVDEADEIAAGFEISQLPTFVYLNLGNIVHRIEGANLQEVLSSIERLDQLVNKEEPEQKQVQVLKKRIEEPKVVKKRIETRSEMEERTEKKPEKKIDIKISKDEEKRKSREIEKKKSKKRSSKESQLKAERRNFENKNPYEIEYNNDTPKISTDDSDDISLESSS